MADKADTPATITTAFPNREPVPAGVPSPAIVKAELWREFFFEQLGDCCRGIDATAWQRRYVISWKGELRWCCGVIVEVFGVSGCSRGRVLGMTTVPSDLWSSELGFSFGKSRLME